MRKGKDKFPKVPPPDNIAEGAKRTHVAITAVFDREDGTGADWPLMVESAFRAAFGMLDKLPKDMRRKVAARVHEGAYTRLVGEQPDQAAPESTGTGHSIAARPAPSASLNGPRPPR